MLSFKVLQGILPASTTPMSKFGFELALRGVLSLFVGAHIELFLWLLLVFLFTHRQAQRFSLVCPSLRLGELGRLGLVLGAEAFQIQDRRLSARLR